MRPLVHKSQALLLLVVGGLAGAVLASAVMQRSGSPAPVMTRAAELVAPRSTHLPARIEITGSGRQPNRGTMTATRGTGETAAAAVVVDPTGPADQPVQGSSGGTTVVPPTVYSYPPDDRGRGTGGGSSGSGSSSGGSTPGGSTPGGSTSGGSGRGGHG